MRQERVTFRSGECTLEGVRHLPEGQGPFAAVVVCHPHPLYGGNMDNVVVIAVCRALNESGMAALRFNFRGVGRSEGRLQGAGLTQDVSAAISFIASGEEGDTERLGVCGYSAGAIAAFSSGVIDHRVRAVAAISPPLSMARFDNLTEWPGPKLVVSGSMDGFTSQADVEQFCGSLVEPVQCDIIDGADHFWWGFEGELGRMVAVFFARSLC